MRSFVWAATVAGLLIATPSGQAQQTAAISVGTVAAALRPITRASEFVGRVEAVERVEIRARVTGYLEAVLFKEGDTVKEGDALYPDRAGPLPGRRAAGARRACCKAQADYLRTPSAQRARTQELVKTDAASRALLDVTQGRGAEGRRRARSSPPTPT